MVFVCLPVCMYRLAYLLACLQKMCAIKIQKQHYRLNIASLAVIRFSVDELSTEFI